MAVTDRASTGYERRKSRKRSQIVVAATDLFRENGFAHVSMAQIAERAGVSQVTIYNHFGDKYSLVRVVVNGITRDKIEEYRSVLASDRPWMERLHTVVADKKQVLRGFHGELVEAVYREYPELVDELRDAQLKAREGITYPFLDEGRRLGYVPKSISNEAVAAFLQVISRGIEESPDLLRRISESPDLFDQIYDLITYGLVWNRDAPDGPGIATE